MTYLRAGGKARRNESDEEKRTRVKLVAEAAATTISWTVDDLMLYTVKKSGLNETDQEDVVARHAAVKKAAAAVKESCSDEAIASLELAVSAMAELYDLN